MSLSKRDICKISFNVHVSNYLIKLWMKYKESKKGGYLLYVDEDNSLCSNIQIKYFDGIDTLYAKVVERVYNEMIIQEAPIDVIKPSSYSETTSKYILDSLELIRSVDCDAYSCIKKYVRIILIVKSEDLVAATSLDFLGIVVIAPKSEWTLIDFVENIVHEASHIDLFMRQLIDPIVIGDKCLPSPFREHLRPQIGVFHATFVLCRIIHIFHKVYKTQIKDDLFKTRLRNTLSSFRESLGVLVEHADLTLMGYSILLLMIDEYNEVNKVNKLELEPIILSNQ